MRYQPLTNQPIMASTPDASAPPYAGYGGGTLSSPAYVGSARSGFRLVYLGGNGNGSGANVPLPGAGACTSLPKRRVGFPIVVELQGTGGQTNVLVMNEGWVPIPHKGVRIRPTYDPALNPGGLSFVTADMMLVGADTVEEMLAPIVSHSSEVYVEAINGAGIAASGTVPPAVADTFALAPNMTEFRIAMGTTASPHAVDVNQFLLPTDSTSVIQPTGTVGLDAVTQAKDLDVLLGCGSVAFTDSGAGGATYIVQGKYQP